MLVRQVLANRLRPTLNWSPSLVLRTAFIFLLCLLITACSIPRVTAESRLFLPLAVDFLDVYNFPKQAFEATPVGGLSGITYDRQRDRFYAISDDRSKGAPARFYTFKLELDQTNPSAPKLATVALEAVTTLLNKSGQPYPKDGIDAEAIALTASDTVFITSEGNIKQGVLPFINEFDLVTGQFKRNLRIPDRFLPNEESEAQGIQQNRGFEGMTLSDVSAVPSTAEPIRLFTVTERSLLQDTSPDEIEVGSRNRLLHYLLSDGPPILVSENIYQLEADVSQDNGLVEILALDGGGHFLGLERSFSFEEGLTIRLFQFNIGGATDTSDFSALLGDLPGVIPIRKQLLLDFKDLNITLDNFEGMTLGPRLVDGSHTLVVVSDDNFNPLQQTKFLVLRLQGL